MSVKTYSLGQRCMAYVLLASLFLQNCYNPYGSITPKLIEEAKERQILQINPPTSEPDQETLLHPHELIADLVVSSPTKEDQAIQLAASPHADVNKLPSEPNKNIERSNFLKTTTPKKARQAADKNGLASSSLLGAQRRLTKAEPRKSIRPSNQGLSQITKPKHVKGLAPTSESIIPVTASTLGASHPLSEQSFVTQEGYQVKFQQAPGERWKALVEEPFPGGISRKLLLPVYLELGQSISALSQKSGAYQKSYIHVVSQNNMRFVWVGSIGLLGGMMEDGDGKEEKKEDQVEEKGKLKTAPISNKPLNPLPWHPSPSLAERIKKQPAAEGQPFKTYTILPEDPECDQVLQRFLLQKPAGYGISKITYMANRIQQQAFEAELVNMEIEAKTFLPQWKEEKEPRDHVIKRWEEQTSPFSPLSIKTPEGPYTLHAAKVLPLWHGSNAGKCSSIAASGFTYFGKHHFFSSHAQRGTKASTDEGFFGSGIYFTTSPRYAAMYSTGEMLLSWVSMREPFPVVSDVPHPDKCADMNMLEGRGAYQNYNAHYIPVASISPGSTRCMTYYPCYKGQTPAWDEIVVFQKAQTLPCFQVSLAADSPELPFKQVYSFASCYDACKKGDLVRVQGWIQEDPKRLYEKSNEQETLCQAAVLGNQLKALQFLHKQDPSLIKERTEEGMTLLHLAAGLGYAEIAAWLDTQDPQQLTEKNSEGWTPLHLAALQEQVEILGCFFKKIHPSFMLEIVGKPCAQALGFLIKKGMNPLITNSSKQTLLHLAAQAGQEENVLCLLSQKLPIDAPDLSKRTPLFLAALQGHRSMVKLLLQHQARLDCVSIEKETILHAAAFYGNTPLLTDLMPCCPELIHAKDHDGKTPLHKAVWGPPKPDVVQFLLSQGAYVDERNSYGYTALHWAAKHGHFDSAKILLHHKADLMAVNQNGDTPLDLAIHWGQDALACLLIDPVLAKKSFHQESTPSKDPEGFYYQQFEAAYEQSEPLDQILYLEKLGDLFLSKQQYIQAAHLCSNALAAAMRYEFEESYQQLLLAKLERIEGLFLEQELGLKTPASHQGYLLPYRHQLSTIRKQAQTRLEMGHPIEEVQQESNRYFRNLFRKIVEGCIDVVGQKPPTGFAILGLGSMGRGEMCPYSDIEFAILIEQETPENIGYFRRLSQLVELRILNLGETAYPLIRPKRIGEVWTEGGSLTPHGFSMDTGGLTPLGKTGVYELIGMPDRISAYQDPSWLEKNEGEAILANALTQGSFLMGNPALVETYKKKVHKVLEGKKSIFGKKLRQERALELLKGHLEEFGPLLDERRIDLRAFDVKKDLYRPIQMIIGALALYYGVGTASTLAQIGELAKQGVLSKEGANRLVDALKQALAWRFQAHLFYQNEKEIFYHAQGEEDPLAQGLLTFGEKEKELLLEIYRVLIPFHQKAQLFSKGQEKSLLMGKLYDESIGKISRQHENDLNYKEALKTYQQSVALNPGDLEGLDHLQRITRQLGRAQEALKYNQERLSILKRKYGEQLDKQEEAAGCYNNIGGSLSALGRHAEALEYHQKALKLKKTREQVIEGEKPYLVIFKSVLPEKHPDTVASYSNMGESLRGLGRYEKALEYHQKALEIQKEMLGEKHHSVAASYNNIGLSLADLGRHTEALEYYQKSLTTSRELLGEKHPGVSTVYNNIGLSLRNLKRNTEALEYYQKSLEIKMGVLGEKHPEVAATYDNIGVSLGMLGRHTEALEYNKKALAIFKEVLGEKHPDVAKSYNNIGSTLGDMGRHAEALECYQKALAVTKEMLGEKHPHVAKSYDSIGMSLKDLGRYAEALEYLKKALEIQKEMRGEKHQIVAINYSNIGSILGDMERPAEALEYKKKALEIQKEVLGEKHPDVATSYNNIGSSLIDLGRHAEALEYHQKALEIFKEVLGAKHPNIAKIYNNIGLDLRGLRRHAEALEYHQKALEMRGVKHLDVAISYNNIGLSLGDMGRPAEALEYMQKALAVTKEMLGEKHPHVATIYNNIGASLRDLGRDAEALEYYQKAAAIGEQLKSGWV